MFSRIFRNGKLNDKHYEITLYNWDTIGEVRYGVFISSNDICDNLFCLIPVNQAPDTELNTLIDEVIHGRCPIIVLIDFILERTTYTDWCIYCGNFMDINVKRGLHNCNSAFSTITENEFAILLRLLEESNKCGTW